MFIMTDLHADRLLDITSETCPMTYVRTRLALDALAPGQVLAVRLRGDEPERNVPRNAILQGHDIIAVRHAADGVTTIWLRRGSCQTA
jgi:TusA-related sulfurtransferase